MSSSGPSASNGIISANGTQAGKPATIAKSPPAISGTSEERKNPAASKQNQASTVWREFENVLQKMSKYSDAYSNIEGIMDQHSAMKLETQTKDLRMLSLESSHEIQIKQFEKRYSEWNQEKILLKRREQTVKDEVIAENENFLKKQEAAYAEVKAELDRERKRVNSITAQLEKVNKRSKRIETDFAACERELREWESHVSILKKMDLKAFGGRVNMLFMSCRKIVHTHFLADLSAACFADHGRWENLSHSLAIPLSFSPTNSTAAKHVRMAAALHVLAGQLCTNFFRPCYIPESAAGGEAVQEILAQQSMTNAGKEPIMRALLLSAYASEEVDAAIARAVQSTSREIISLLSPFLSSSVEAFYADLEALLYETAEVWKEAQHSEKMVEASMIEENDWPWEDLDEFDSAVAAPQAQPGPQKFNMLNLFPRVFVTEDNHIVYPGVVLWPDQNTVHAADQEFGDWMAARRTNGGRGPDGNFLARRERERRKSTLTEGKVGNGGYFLDKPRPRSQTLASEITN